jgi:hypothetical protein
MLFQYRQKKKSLLKAAIFLPVIIYFQPTADPSYGLPDSFQPALWDNPNRFLSCSAWYGLGLPFSELGNDIGWCLGALSGATSLAEIKGKARRGSDYRNQRRKNGRTALKKSINMALPHQYEKGIIFCLIVVDEIIERSLHNT